MLFRVMGSISRRMMHKIGLDPLSIVKGNFGRRGLVDGIV